MDSNIKTVVSNITVLILAVGFLGVGMVKLVDHPETVASFAKWGLPSWSIYLIGIFEISMALLLYYKPTRKFAIYFTALHVFGALTIHILNQENDQFYGPILVLVLLTALFFSEK